MSIWASRASSKDTDYIVVKHALRGINYVVMTAKFRDSYAVVERNGKIHKMLKKIPLLKNMEEFPLLHLEKLRFITRESDIRTVYGTDVYSKFQKLKAERDNAIKAAQEEQARIEHEESADKCKYALPSGDKCKRLAMTTSPSQYCPLHVISDPRLPELGIEIPELPDMAAKKKFRKAVTKKLEKLDKKNNKKD